VFAPKPDFRHRYTFLRIAAGLEDPVSRTALKQRLAARIAAGAAGYSRLMATDEPATVAALAIQQQLVATSGGVL
jgi:hypothetical protein